MAGSKETFKFENGMVLYAHLPDGPPVTEEMISAGCSVFDYDEGWTDINALLTDVYRAMYAARPRKDRE